MAASALARRLLRYEADVAFRRRAVTVLSFLDPQPGDRILEDGCGLGFYLHLLRRLSSAEVWGVELDRERLRRARADRYAATAHTVQADVTRLPFPDACFDKVVSSEVLEHLPDDAAALAEVARVLKPGGVCAITVPNADYPWPWDPVNYVREALGLGHFSSGPLAGVWTDHRRLYRERELRDLVERAGLAVTATRLETRHTFPFSHNLVYVVGRRLIEAGLAGRGSQDRGGRAALWTDEQRLTPARLLASVVTAVDRLNRDCYSEGPAVSLCLRAVRPT